MVPLSAKTAIMLPAPRSMCILTLTRNIYALNAFNIPLCWSFPCPLSAVDVHPSWVRWSASIRLLLTPLGIVGLDLLAPHNPATLNLRPGTAAAMDYGCKPPAHSGSPDAKGVYANSTENRSREENQSEMLHCDL